MGIMFGISMGELILIFLAAFIVVGPGDLPKLARMLGRLIKNARKAVRDLSDAVDAESLRKTAGLDEDASLAGEIREAGKVVREIENGIKGES
jgi:Sec-independent protein translocase protein TatA